MAQRPIFLAKNSFPFFEEINEIFTYYNGFSITQKLKCVQSLHEAFNAHYSKRNILEISTKSTEALGKMLSAFNLSFYKEKTNISVECAFQSSKVFQNGGPYKDLLNGSSLSAKKDLRLKSSGNLTSFKFYDMEFPLEPKDYFYNWLYINTLVQNEELAKGIIKYNAFSDIEFNPKKSINCQAKACAIYVGLFKSNKLQIALKSKEDFLKVVYSNFDVYEQITF